jgi:hypothetical protein
MISAIVFVLLIIGIDALNCFPGHFINDNQQCEQCPQTGRGRDGEGISRYYSPGGNSTACLDCSTARNLDGDWKDWIEYCYRDTMNVLCNASTISFPVQDLNDGQIRCACAKGSHIKLRERTKCAKCEPGKFSNQDLFDFNCDSCPQNTFSNVSGMTFCYNCPKERPHSSGGDSTCGCKMNQKLNQDENICLDFCDESAFYNVFYDHCQCIGSDIPKYNKTKDKMICEKCSGSNCVPSCPPGMHYVKISNACSKHEDPSTEPGTGSPHSHKDDNPSESHTLTIALASVGGFAFVLISSYFGYKYWKKTRNPRMEYQPIH